MKITNCLHTEMKHYAKGKCKSCYNKSDRSSRAIHCPHNHLANYAHGLCSFCYFAYYNHT